MDPARTMNATCSLAISRFNSEEADDLMNVLIDPIAVHPSMSWQPLHPDATGAVLSATLLAQGRLWEALWQRS